MRISKYLVILVHPFVKIQENTGMHAAEIMGRSFHVLSVTNVPDAKCSSI